MDQGQNFFQWMTLGLGAAGFFLTWTGIVIGLTKTVSSIQTDTSEKISEETAKITDRVTKLAEQFEEDQRTQDNRFGEVALSIRQYVANVEKEMHQIEIWGRDNFVLKTDFLDATRRLENVIEKLAADMRDDFKTLITKIDDIKDDRRSSSG